MELELPAPHRRPGRRPCGGPCRSRPRSTTAPSRSGWIRRARSGSGSLLLFDRQFEVIHKKGDPDQPIGEIDLKAAQIYVNWGHPVKLQMDERGFLRTALAWVLAKEAANKDPSHMMDLALRLLAFNTYNDG